MYCLFEGESVLFVRMAEHHSIVTNFNAYRPTISTSCLNIH